MSEITRRPTRLAGAVASAGVVCAVAAAGLASTTGLAVALVGAALFAVGLVIGSRATVDLGCLVLFGGVVAGGLGGPGHLEVTLLGTVAAAVAWDLGGSAIDLGYQLGREPSTARLEAVHVASTLLVGLASVTVGYAVYVVAAAGQPVDALVLLLVAGAAATLALGARRGWPASGRRSRRGRR